jgi:hypothetical protein
MKKKSNVQMMIKNLFLSNKKAEINRIVLTHLNFLSSLILAI